MKFYYSDHFNLPLPEGHRFPLPKYAALRQKVTDAHLGEMVASVPATDDQLLLVHEADYVRRFVSGEMTEKEMRRVGFPWSPELVERSRRSVGGTIGAARAALLEGYAATLAGGTHHAYPDHGEGYCVFNDVAVAIRVLQSEDRLRRALVLDCDVHQGNGTAFIFAQDPSVYTFSIHGQKNFPFHKEIGSLDVALPDSSDDTMYLQALRPAALKAIDEAEADLAVYIAGADPFVGDRLGRMAMSKAGLLARDRFILQACQTAGLPLVITLGGGYAKQVEDTVDIHFSTMRLAAELADHHSSLSS